MFNPGVSNELNSALQCGCISLQLELIFFFSVTELVTHLAVLIVHRELFCRDLLIERLI